jgi:hypothetical protein|tara:strand:+ start:182 stop:1264 length:1083 start_codon:yes stop_codon:yes gene_type:complete
MLTGNRGEWSEIYVFLKLLADGQLNAADANLNIIPDVYYPILEILRQESGKTNIYQRNTQIKIIDGETSSEILSIPIIKFLEKSILLFNSLKDAEGSSFSFPVIERFLNEIKISSLSASCIEKADINVVVHDLNTGLTPKLGFSIKSMLGKSSTLFNPGNTTNFIYEIIGDADLEIEEINRIDAKPKIVNRIKALLNDGFELSFKKIQSNTLELNLQLIDSDLPKILSELLLIKYSSKGLAQMPKIIEKIISTNPLEFDLSSGHPFYEYKLKKFLIDSALGMTPARIWTGQYDATGGIIIVKQDGELVCYHIYNRNEFQDYLLNNTRIEQASTSRYEFGSLYKDNDKIFMKLNLQIRFNK